MSRYAGEWQNQGLQVYAISSDTQDVVDKAKKENPITLELISDPDGNVARSAGLSDDRGAQEGFSVVDKGGNIIYKEQTFHLAGEIPDRLQRLGVIK